MPSPGASVPLTDAVDRLVPVGKTPLTAAVETAASALRIEETRATVILVTDGIETCDRDLCVSGLSLEQRGLDFTAHIIGFGLSADEGRQVACLAEETGGRYIEALNAGELSEALESVSDVVGSSPPEAATATASIDGPESVEIGASFSVSWEGPGPQGDYVDIVPKGHERTSGELSYSYKSEGSLATLRAPGEPGDYVLRYVWTAPQGRTVLVTRPIKVTGADVALIAAPSIGIGEPLTVDWRGRDNPGDYVDIVPRGHTQTSGENSYTYVKADNPLTIRLPDAAGDYDLRYVFVSSTGRAVRAVRPIRVTPAGVTLDMPASVAAGARFNVGWTGPGYANDYVDLVPEGHTRTSSELSYAYTKSGETLRLKAPGDSGAFMVS